MKLLHYPDKALRKHCHPVSHFDHRLRELVNKMAEIMARERGIGIAAPQVGSDLQVMIVSDGVCKPIVMINPQLSFPDNVELIRSDEGCLSFPGEFVEVLRAKEVDVEYTSVDKKRRKLRGVDLLARCIQHEHDHLNGVLLIDYKGGLYETSTEGITG